MKKNTENTNTKKLVIMREVEDFLGKYLPAKALEEISRMVEYSGYDGEFSIRLEDATARAVNPYNISALDYKRNYNPEEPFILNLDYDMKVSRKYKTRKAVSTTELLFKGDDERIYSVVMVLSSVIKAPIQDYDEMVSSAHYLYTKEMFESMDISPYISKKVKLPENYSCIDEDSKDFYDGYVVHRNHGKIEHVIKGGTLHEA